MDTNGRIHVVVTHSLLSSSKVNGWIYLLICYSFLEVLSLAQDYVALRVGWLMSSEFERT
jgi:hypothetical protein